ncbi:hypothetical protein B0H10DRAFT_2195390 [Mycena sp. CBHHK59/15]|nr:hypothetical protein B0H10DRAFT_2195390 [Mycena sp. CBHHK59/15]
MPFKNIDRTPASHGSDRRPEAREFWVGTPEFIIQSRETEELVALSLNAAETGTLQKVAIEVMESGSKVQHDDQVYITDVLLVHVRKIDRDRNPSPRAPWVAKPKGSAMNNAGCIAALSEDSASRLWIGSPRPCTIVYNLHGLDHESESATTNLGSVQLPLNNGGRGLQSKHLLPLVLPQKAARVSNLGSVGRLTTTCQAGEMVNSFYSAFN